MKDSPIDIPLALLYSIADSHEASWSNPNLSHTEVSDSVICVLEGCIGIPRGHQFAAERIKLFGQEQDDSVLSNHLRTALKEVSPVVSNISEKSQDILRTLGKVSRHRYQVSFHQDTDLSRLARERSSTNHCRCLSDRTE